MAGHLLFIELRGTARKRAHHSLFGLHGVHSSNGATPAAKSINLGRRLTPSDQLTTVVETGEEVMRRSRVFLLSPQPARDTSANVPTLKFLDHLKPQFCPRPIQQCIQPLPHRRRDQKGV